MTELPMACSLSAAELPGRLAEMSAIGRDALLEAERSERRTILRFRRGDQTRERLDAIVAAESSCCAFLSLELREDSDGIALTIGAPPGGEPVVDDLVAVFSAELHSG